jgi:epoxyqueuosine reductase
MPDNSPISSGKMGQRSYPLIPDAQTSSRVDTATASRVKQLAQEAGFDLCRVTSASPLHVERVRYLQWLGEGRQGSMQWMSPERAHRSTEPSDALSVARSIICVGMAYWAGHRSPLSNMSGSVARYAWGDDYHQVIGERLEHLASSLTEEFGAQYRWYVDTGPMMDKALAARSGLGWYGKNTNILTEQFGSFVLLGEIITSLDLPTDETLSRDCGSCRLCVVACPTGALRPDYSIDAARCISYLTIEHRDAIPVELRSAMGNWVFGCDICQDVCPPTMSPHLKSSDERRAWTVDVRRLLSHAPSLGGVLDSENSTQDTDSRDSHPLYERGVRQTLDLRQLLFLTHEEYLQAFRGTAIKRAKVWMLRRNAAVAFGNVGDESCISDLATVLHTDDHPIVRGHAAWALGEIGRRTGAEEAWAALKSALSVEKNPDVAAEIVAAQGVRTQVSESG